MKLIEVDNPSAAFVFGRFNPPTIGHKKLFDKLKSVSSVYFVFVSSTQDPKKNPLNRDQKIALIDRQFPEAGDHIINDPNIRTIIDVMQWLEQAGHKRVAMVVGSDRVKGFHDLLAKYNGGKYNFDSIDIISAGDRDPDSDDVSGISASKAREAAAAGDYETFKTMFVGNEGLKKNIYRAVRTGMGIREDWKDVYENVVNERLDEGAIFLSPTAVIVGQDHAKALSLSPETLEKVQAIADKFGAYSEGNRGDEKFTKGQINTYKGSWDDEVATALTSETAYPFLYTMMANVKENNTLQKIGANPRTTIFDHLLLKQAVYSYFPKRKISEDTLRKFLEAISEGEYDFVQMSQQPATPENIKKFIIQGEKLMWPSNWESYPYNAGKTARKATLIRDKWLANRKQGVYVVGMGHLEAVKELTGKPVEEEAAGVGIVTKQNTTPDVNKKTLGKIMKALRLK